MLDLDIILHNFFHGFDLIHLIVVHDTRVVVVGIFVVSIESHFESIHIHL